MGAAPTTDAACSPVVDGCHLLWGVWNVACHGNSRFVQVQRQTSKHPCLNCSRLNRHTVWEKKKVCKGKGTLFWLAPAPPPSPKGMERRDLIAKNVPIMVEHGRALAKRASKGVRVLVVANPACTNCLIVSVEKKRRCRSSRFHVLFPLFLVSVRGSAPSCLNSYRFVASRGHARLGPCGAPLLGEVNPFSCASDVARFWPRCLSGWVRRGL